MLVVLVLLGAVGVLAMGRAAATGPSLAAYCFILSELVVAFLLSAPSCLSKAILMIVACSPARECQVFTSFFVAKSGCQPSGQ